VPRVFLYLSSFTACHFLPEPRLSELPGRLPRSLDYYLKMKQELPDVKNLST
jgi:hypothetical protein